MASEKIQAIAKLMVRSVKDYTARAIAKRDEQLEPRLKALEARLAALEERQVSLFKIEERDDPPLRAVK